MNRSLIEKFGSESFSKPSSKKITMFDVAGFPHYENVASNVLQFFLDTNNDHLHGFGNVWLMAFINAYNNKTVNKIPVMDYYTNEVIRECSGSDDKRIDLLVDCGALVIVIENKIWADLYNDLEIYTEIAKNRKELKNDIRGIVLSLIPLKDKEEYLDKVNYVNIVYEDLFDYLEQHYSFDDHNKWQMFAKEFMTNIRQQRGIVNMKFDTKWLKFVSDNGKSLNNLLEISKNDLEMRITVVKELDKTFDDFPGIVRHGPYTYPPERYVSEFVDVYRDDGVTICIETYLMKVYSEKDYEKFDKVYVALWSRRNKNYDFTSVFKKLNIEKPKEIKTKGWGKHYILYEMELNDNFDIQELKRVVTEYVKRLLNK